MRHVEDASSMCELAEFLVKNLSPFYKMCVCFASTLEVVEYLNGHIMKNKAPAIICLIVVIKCECCLL